MIKENGAQSAPLDKHKSADLEYITEIAFMKNGALKTDLAATCWPSRIAGCLTALGGRSVRRSRRTEAQDGNSKAAFAAPAARLDGVRNGGHCYQYMVITFHILIELS